MVKGISRRVVVVRPPDPSVFEEAIFVVRENRNAPRDVLREACAVAETYLRRSCRAAILAQALDKCAACAVRARRRQCGRSALGTHIYLRYFLSNP